LALPKRGEKEEASLKDFRKIEGLLLTWGVDFRLARGLSEENVHSNFMWRGGVQNPPSGKEKGSQSDVVKKERH